MSDNAETREAVAWLYEVLAEGGLGGTEEEDRRVQIVLDDWQRLAALPPVAGPEVRPDETLRARVEALTEAMLKVERKLFAAGQSAASEVMRGALVQEALTLSQRALNVDRSHATRAALASPAPAATEVGEGER